VSTTNSPVRFEIVRLDNEEYVIALDRGLLEVLHACVVTAHGDVAARLSGAQPGIETLTQAVMLDQVITVRQAIEASLMSPIKQEVRVNA